jgi:hypothetical protein
MRTKTLLTLTVLAFSTAAWSAGKMKPGLWEISLASDEMKGAMKDMPEISPEQMEAMKKMGVNIPHMQGDTMKTKVCITKEMAEKDQPPEMNRKESGCQSKNYQRSGNNYTLDVVCDGPDMKGEGKVKGTFTGNDSFNSTYEFKGTSSGRPVDQKSQSSGKWLSADCGEVKPFAPPSPQKK